MQVAAKAVISRLMARLIDGRAFAANLRAKVAAEVADLQRDHGLTPGLAVVLVGEDPASQVYVRNKGEQTKEAGMLSVTHRLDEATSQEALLALVEDLNADPAIHGILVQFPVPAQIDQGAVIAAISPDKDVDGLNVINAGRLASGLPALTPCTPLGCMLLVRDILGENLAGKRAIVIGRSNLVGKPIAQLLLAADCTVTIAHSRTQDLPELCKEHDIVVAAVGRAQMVKRDWVKAGAVVIDVGMNRIPGKEPGKTRLVGDVDFADVEPVAGAITPVPGGVGPMTIACLLQNTLTAAKRLHGLS